MSDEQTHYEQADQQDDVKQSSIIRAVRWAISIDPSECQKKTDSMLRRYSRKKDQSSSGRSGGQGGGKDGSPPDRERRRKMAEKIVAEYAVKGAAAGFATGMPANLAASLPLAVADTGTLLHFYCKVNAMVGYLADPHYYEQEGWQDDILIILAGASRLLKEIAIEGGKHTAKTLIKQYIRKGALKTLQRWVLKWFGKKVTQRAIISKTVPIVGGGLGGTWNYIEVRVIGKRIIKYHFDDSLE